jgi:hypothetical protein
VTFGLHATPVHRLSAQADRSAAGPRGQASGSHPEPAARGALIPERACCCPARPVVRVVMPPTPARPHQTDLLLCGHHYRVSRHAPAAAHATVCELPTPGGGAAAALLPDLDPSCVPAGHDTRPPG